MLSYTVSHFLIIFCLFKQSLLPTTPLTASTDKRTNLQRSGYTRTLVCPVSRHLVTLTLGVKRRHVKCGDGNGWKRSFGLNEKSTKLCHRQKKASPIDQNTTRMPNSDVLCRSYLIYVSITNYQWPSREQIHTVQPSGCRQREAQVCWVHVRFSA